MKKVGGCAFIDVVCATAFQGCPCPMQSCPKNVDTGALIGNGKGAPVVSGPGLSLPPSALVGPPSPARGLAGLAPPHGANAWDTDRVQINTHRNLNQNQPPSVPPSHNIVGGHSRLQNQDCRSKVRALTLLRPSDLTIFGHILTFGRFEGVKIQIRFRHSLNTYKLYLTIFL